MVEVIFKDVNQGDSILIKWEENENEKIGIIDCSEANDNPILSYIKMNNYKEIEFLLISHPHSDHFSGVNNLLEYIIKSKIIIRNLCFSFDTTILEIPNLSSKMGENINSFFQKIVVENRKSKKSEKIIKDIILINDKCRPLEFENFKIEFRRPLTTTIVKLIDSFKKRQEGIIKSSPDFNEFSSIIEISNDSKAILLTSDAPKSTFQSLKFFYTKNKKVKDLKFHLVQAPHHGSDKNHYESFWSSLNRIENCPVVFSVGNEKKDRLPKLEVVESYSKNNYEIYSTNCVYGINEFINGEESPANYIPTILNFSAPPKNKTKLRTASRYSGDQIFKINFSA